MYPFNSKDRKEGYYIGRDYQPDDSLYDTTPFHGSNVMPDAVKYPLFAERVMRYHSEMERLAYRLSELIFNTLGLYGEESPVNVPGNFDQPLNALRLIHYPAVPHDESELILADGTVDSIYGNGAHTDSGMLTILSTDGSKGLQIELPNGKGWYDIPAREDCFVVNLADMLCVWSNGIYKSTRHRVVRPPGSATRYSLPFFYDPNYSCNVSPLAVCITAEHPCRYPPVTCGQHIMKEFKKGLLAVTPELMEVTKETYKEYYHEEQKEGEAPKSNSSSTSADHEYTAASKFSNQWIFGESTAVGCGASYEEQLKSRARDGEESGCGASYDRVQQSDTGCGESYRQQLATDSETVGCGESYRVQLKNSSSNGSGNSSNGLHMVGCGESYKMLH